MKKHYHTCLWTILLHLANTHTHTHTLTYHLDNRKGGKLLRNCFWTNKLSFSAVVLKQEEDSEHQSVSDKLQLFFWVWTQVIVPAVTVSSCERWGGGGARDSDWLWAHWGRVVGWGSQTLKAKRKVCTMYTVSILWILPCYFLESLITKCFQSVTHLPQIKWFMQSRSRPGKAGYTACSCLMR